MSLLLLLNGNNGGAAAPTYATWNDADAGSGFTFSGDLLTASHPSGGWASARANIGKTSGNWFFTLSVVGNVNCFIGAAVGGTLPAYPGEGGHLSWGLNNAGYVAGPASLSSSGVSGSLFGCVIKRSTDEILFYVDGVHTHTFDASAAHGQAMFPMVSIYNENGGPANFGASAFGMSVPSGVNAGVYS